MATRLKPGRTAIQMMAAGSGKRESSNQAEKGEEIDPGVVKGTDLRIVKYPHPALRTDNEEITEFDENLGKLAKEMLKVKRV